MKDVQKYILNSQRIKLSLPMLGVVVPQVMANVFGGEYILSQPIRDQCHSLSIDTLLIDCI